MSGNCISVGWEAGASAQIEVFGPADHSADRPLRLKYTPPFRATIRPPIRNISPTRAEIENVREGLHELIAKADKFRGLPAAAPPRAPTGNGVLSDAKLLGNSLFLMLLPPDVQAELRTGKLYLEVGTDEHLVDLPWEILCDGEEFLSTNHLFGRYVNLTTPATPPAQRAPDEFDSEQLSVLLISVPRPLPRGNQTFDALPDAEAETRETLRVLTAFGGAVKVTLLAAENARQLEILRVVNESPRFHIVHFIGHAFFDKAEPSRSGLVLHDKNMTGAPLASYFRNKPPVFFLMNACETGVVGGEDGGGWGDRYDIFGLGRAFLETGAYLIGNRWKVGDASASIFAQEFYKRLIDGCPLGRAVCDARVACMKARPDDLSWASYIFYGDPRVCFTNIGRGQAGQQSGRA